MNCIDEIELAPLRMPPNLPCGKYCFASFATCAETGDVLIFRGCVIVEEGAQEPPGEGEVQE